MRTNRQEDGRVRSTVAWLTAKLSRVTSSNEYIPEIDGLRCIALIPVLTLHSTAHFLIVRGLRDFDGNWSLDHGFILRVLGLGWIGVQIFFVISGFVVALPFARHSLAGGPAPRLQRYFLRRFTRIEPPYIMAFLAIYLLSRAWSQYLPHLLAGLVYMHQLIFGARNPVNIVTWSLEIEIFFYLLAPLLTFVYLIPNRTYRWVLQIALIACYSYAVEFWLVPRASPRFRDTIVQFLPYFFAGILIADLYACGIVRRSRRLVWDIVALASTAGILYVFAWDWRAKWLGPFLIVLLLLGGMKGLILNRFLRLRLVTVVGGMCYSIYLWHTALLGQFGNAWTRVIPQRLSTGPGALLFCMVAVPLLIAAITPIFYFLEKPFMNGPGSRYLERTLFGSHGDRNPSQL